ncbi:hypothetical protein JD844_006504 [Phrynosoma platyrhinos]|uniref:Partial AB-hydrolase lipase domain-containing protein n=1 Tax=Phrynosoma platyrhinos TaxID=52577 RepID=A0ABQ7T1V2_PHRPL|nr:hypothetical protein JD844_006504 [Phrynosoma platyrhinos]
MNKRLWKIHHIRSVRVFMEEIVHDLMNGELKSSYAYEDKDLKSSCSMENNLYAMRMKMWIFIIAACLWQGIISLRGSYAPKEPGSKFTVDPECFLNVSEIIRYHGYPSEEHHIETEDGYILTVFRIPHGRYNEANKGSRPTVFLQHAVLGDASHWISNEPNNSLGFILADAGYDVWLGNSRGNTYSSKHKTLKTHERKFWEFSIKRECLDGADALDAKIRSPDLVIVGETEPSFDGFYLSAFIFHEMGYYDIPAVIDVILKKTAQDQLYFVGHSEGSAVGPKKGQSHMLSCCLPGMTVLPLLSDCTLKERIVPPSQVSFVAFSTWPKLTERIKVFFALAPVTTVTFAITPFTKLAQLSETMFRIHNSKLFRAYDYGSAEKNKKKYNQTVPSIYKIEDIKIPIAFWTGGHDFFVDSRDVAMLSSRISNIIYEKHIPEWQHLDFIWGLDAPEKMYMDIIEIMKTYP